ncbi:chemotaxis protein CheA [Siculibacillus lacustris]|uniref:Chemotaxis protein CheA n=1 Tax=Siculibacillus lacustris TaxID=1549641 RepID=A0A4V6MZ26_9HYPH|nr:chemotaxis protein CheA [Siculibacillus lacustris]TBW37614.1 chemotaxis protein CheA [Siculibacillus lacustris]
MNISDPKEIFRQEAQDLLALLETTLLDLERAPGDGALIDTAFRALHTIKGSGSMFGFEVVAGFTHHVETAFDKVRQGTLAPNRELIAVALRARDHMRILIEEPEAADSAAGDAVLDDLRRIIAPAGAGAATVATTVVAAAPSGAPEVAATWRIRMKLPADAMANGTNPLLILDELRSLGAATVTAVTDAVPGLADIDPSVCHVTWEVDLTTSEPLSTIEDVFMFIRDEMTLEISPLEVAAATPSEGATVPAPGPAASAKIAAPAPATAPSTATPDARRDAAAARANSSVRVPAERLDELMERVGELVITQSRLRQISVASSDPSVKAVAEEIERLVLELRDTTMGIRMVPIGSLFGRFRRVVHDLSRDLGKQVELIMQGEETELDKTVIEQLNDPLVHMIRNAIDHGLEDPQERLAAGKSHSGRMVLSAEHAGTEVLIRLSDDGRGLDRDRIRERAVQRGLIAADAVLSDAELFQVLFLPGFSTAATVTSMSGRGVGMDVVKRTIEGLRGSIDLASTAGQGTRVTLRLPLTLAIIDGLLVRVGNGRYVVPLNAVEECVELSSEEDARSRGLSFLNIRGDLVPFLRLRELFAAKVPADRYQKVVVVSSGDLKVGLVVDQVIGDHQTVIKSLSKLHADIQMFSGATILGDGAVALILDVAQLVGFGQAQEERLKAVG